MKKTIAKRLYVPDRNAFEEQKEERERIAIEKTLCPHGFKRAIGTVYDCHFCVEADEKALDTMVSSDIEYQEHGA